MNIHIFETMDLELESFEDFESIVIEISRARKLSAFETLIVLPSL